MPEDAMFVQAGWLRSVLSLASSKEQAGKKPLIIETGSDGLAAYQEGHIPGAIYLDTNSIESGPAWNILPATELERAFSSHGIRYDRTTVIYSRTPFAAARAAMVLLYAGAQDLLVLDGGFQAWLAAGFELEIGENTAAPVESFGVCIPVHPEYVIDRQAAEALPYQSHGRLVCVRTWEEFIGEHSGYTYILSKGRIPGSVWGGSIGTPSFLNTGGTIRSLAEIEAFWQEHGLTRQETCAFYCGTGWRASEAFIYVYMMGWERISIYDGGWLDWISQSNPAIESGEPDPRTLS